MLYELLEFCYGNMFRSFFRPYSGQLSKVRCTIHAYYVLWDPYYLKGVRETN